jgi:16S rRNA U516 pseudouridylate synthase RsuA-like enzyme
LPHYDTLRHYRFFYGSGEAQRKKRHIRRMLELLGDAVQRLLRYRIGAIGIGDVNAAAPPGKLSQ